jgi:hypothetical protein
MGSSTITRPTSIPKSANGSHPRCWRPTSGQTRVHGSNAIESFFAIVTKRRLKCGVFRSFVDLPVDAYLKAEPDNSDQKDQTTDSCQAPLATPTASRITSQSRRAKDSYNLSPITWPMDMRLVHRGYRAGRRTALRLQLDPLADSGRRLLFE